MASKVVHRAAPGFLYYLQALTIVALCVTPACASNESSNQRTIRETRVGTGIACTVDGKTGPISYAATAVDAGSSHGFTRSDLAILRKIEAYVHPKTLRVAMVGHEFVVFDAIHGPCYGGAPGYFVLNGGCNEFYAVTDDFYSTTSVPNCYGPPRPWIPHDPGSGSPQAWKNYNNSN